MSNGRRRGVLLAGVVVLGTTLTGCGGDDDECGTEPAQACCDFVAAVVDACVRCSSNSMELCEDAVRESIDVASNHQGCKGADQIRDRDSFYEECLPAMETTECSELEAGNLPVACRSQILYRL